MLNNPTNLKRNNADSILALYSGRGLGRGLEVQSPRTHVFCGSGEDVCLGPPGCPVGGAAGVWGEGVPSQGHPIPIFSKRELRA